MKHRGHREKTQRTQRRSKLRQEVRFLIYPFQSLLCALRRIFRISPSVPSVFQKADGYTILEALIAIVIISILAFPLYRLLSTEKKITTAARDQAAAYFVASSEMEALKASPVKPEDIQANETQAVMNGKTFTVKRMVKQRFDYTGGLVDSIGKNMREIRVEVSLGDKNLATLNGLFGGMQAAKRDSTEIKMTGMGKVGL